MRSGQVSMAGPGGSTSLLPSAEKLFSQKGEGQGEEISQGNVEFGATGWVPGAAAGAVTVPQAGVMAAPHRACLHRPWSAHILSASWYGARTDCRFISELGKALTDPWDLAPFLLWTDGFAQIRKTDGYRSATGVARPGQKQNADTHYAADSSYCLCTISMFATHCKSSLQHSDSSLRRGKPACGRAGALTPQHVVVRVVSDGEDVGRSLRAPLAFVRCHNLRLVDRQPLVGVYGHTE